MLSGPQKTGAEPPVDDSPVAQLMGMRQDKITRCSKCHTKITSGKPNPTSCRALQALHVSVIFRRYVPDRVGSVIIWLYGSRSGSVLDWPPGSGPDTKLIIKNHVILIFQFLKMNKNLHHFFSTNPIFIRKPRFCPNKNNV